MASQKSQGYLPPATTAEDATEGTAAWTNVNNTQAEDASYANSLVAVNPLAGASSSVKAPSTAEEDTSEGEAIAAWGNINNVKAEDGNFAIALTANDPS